MAEQSHAAEQQVEERPRRSRLGLALGIMALVCGIAVYNSSLFRAVDIKVTGLKRLTQERVLEAAGLSPGAPRWEHPASAIVAALEREPWVRKASATWEIGRLRLVLVEAEPVGLVRYSDRFYLELDENGRILAQSELATDRGLPVITPVAAAQDSLKGLRGESASDPGLLDALTLLWRMAPELRGQISEVQVEQDRSLMLYMSSGATVKWGQVPTGEKRLDAVDEKVKDFGGLWQILPKKRSGCRIDMRVDGKPTEAGCQ